MVYYVIHFIMVQWFFSKKGDKYNLDNYWQPTLMNVDYKILAKITMKRLNNVLEIIIGKEKEQTCTTKGHLMWDNLCYSQQHWFLHLRTVPTESFWLFVVWLSVGHSERTWLPCWFDQKWSRFFMSTIQVNVNSLLSEPFEMSCMFWQSVHWSKGSTVIMASEAASSLLTECQLWLRRWPNHHHQRADRARHLKAKPGSVRAGFRSQTESGQDWGSLDQFRVQKIPR